MRWPIRNQIFVPFAALVMVAVMTIAIFSAWLAARRSEQQTIGQLHQVLETLGQSSFPFAPNVLEKMRGLSGAHFIVWGTDDRVMASTLPAATARTMLPRPGPIAEKLTALDPAVDLGGVRYLVAVVRSAPRPGVKALWVLYPERSWQAARWDAALPPLIVGAGTLVLMLAISAWLANRLHTRIQQVGRQVAAIAGGDFREVDAGTRRDEIQELVASVNQMSRQLRQMQQTIRQSERSRLLGQLAGGMAHQLRNAVTGARLAVQIHAKRCPLGPDESLAVALRQLALTEEQVKGFLSLGRLERRPPRPCAVGALVAEVAGLVGPTCEHAKVRLEYSRGESLPTLEADVEGLRSAILNLVLNAIEAAGPQGEVQLQTLAKAGELWVEVLDSGPGPPLSTAETLFEPFVTSKREGAGLGLALARQVATDHGGQLSWQRFDGRTCFRLVLPLAEGACDADLAESPELYVV